MGEQELRAELARLVKVNGVLLKALKGLLDVWVECVEPTCPFGEAAQAEHAARLAIRATER